MSVINQMLKDLDKRQTEQRTGANAITLQSTEHSSSKLIIIVAVIILINILAIIAWQFYSENKELKALTFQSTQVNNIKNTANETIKVKKTTNSTLKDEIVKNIQMSDKLAISDKEKESTNKAINKTTENVDTLAINKRNVSNITETNSDTATVSNHLHTAAVKKTPVTPVAKTSSKPLPSKPSLTITRSQLSPQALSEKKIKQAEKAIEARNLIKAESLFEEVLLLIPEHTIARKQLAALWYGKKSYQDAINLLSQGISLEPLDEEMRLMSAKIYLEQDKSQQALNILMPVNSSDLIELQAILANIAAELNKYDIASKSYKKLIILEPNIARWWLGLAVSHDRQGKFALASHAYSQAIAKGNLSNNALQFARQRISELGE